MAKYHPSSVTPVAPGTRVIKLSGKPFKSGEKVATVKGVIDHPQLPGEPAYTLVEDDSYVRCSYCTTSCMGCPDAGDCPGFADCARMPVQVAPVRGTI